MTNEFNYFILFYLLVPDKVDGEVAPLRLELDYYMFWVAFLKTENIQN